MFRPRKMILITCYQARFPCNCSTYLSSFKILWSFYPLNLRQVSTKPQISPEVTVNLIINGTTHVTQHVKSHILNKTIVKRSKVGEN